MKLVAARVRNYRSVRDTGWFEVEPAKTILVGPNEAGKTAVLEALQRLNAPDDISGFNALRDYPRAHYNADIQSGKMDPGDIVVASAKFSLEKDDLDALPDGYGDDSLYVFERMLDNSSVHLIEGGPSLAIYTDNTRKDLDRTAKHVDQRAPENTEEEAPAHATALGSIVGDWKIGSLITARRASALGAWLTTVESLIDEDNATADKRHSQLLAITRIPATRDEAVSVLRQRLPVFVYYNNYFRVRPNIHLAHFAERVEQNLLDDDRYDYGNLCLLKLLGFTPRELAELGNPADPGEDQEAFERYRAQLDERGIKLNAASVRLSTEIRSVWNPDPDKPEADTLRVQADGQYLKVVVEDDLGVEIELDQRSEGFQWLVSFFVVFFAEAVDRLENSILLLDEPGLSLHGLKQREFRRTVTRLAEANQTIYTTHSPFLVGPDELDLVRVVEMTDRDSGTVVHTNVTASDPAALLPLQEALGYDLAQSLFAQQRNLILEGLTDYWYIDATNALLADSGAASLNPRIALVPASSAGKVVYFATILHAHRLKVAALLDSDAAGNAAASVETLVHTLGNTNILRTADAHTGGVKGCEIEDILRNTLVDVARDDLGWDIGQLADQQPNRPIIDIFSDEIGKDFSKYRLAKAYLRWTRDHEASDLSEVEHAQWEALIELVNKALK